MRNKIIKILITISIATILIVSFAGCRAKINLASGLNWEVMETTKLASLTIADGATINATDGYSMTMTVKGVETGIVPGTYKGDIVLTVTEANVVKYKHLTHYFRQALYLDENGVNSAKSVLTAAGNYRYSNGTLTGAKITSVGENFNGIFVKGGTHTIKDAVIDFIGNGGDDFAGYGAAVMATGKDTTIVLDGAKIKTHGAVRTGVVVTRNSNVVVKNSTIQTMNGILPSDYVPNVTMGEMLAVPWMLGISGNCRATNLLGKHATATYINSSISSESWGVLSIDGDDETQEPVEGEGREERLIAINSKITNTGKVGYGAYANVSYYGCEVNVGDYAVIGGGIFAASIPETIGRLNADYKLGLTPEELGALPETRTHVKSGRFGLMFNGGNHSVKVMDNTIFDTEKAVFLVKGASGNINVDGSKGVQLNPRNGIIIQIMDSDDPGARTADGKTPSGMDDKMYNTGVYNEPPITKVKGFDVTAINSSDLLATFANITLKGDFYNGFPGGSNTGGGGMTGGSTPTGKNMVLKLENANITGIISASTAKHAKGTVTSEDYLMLGEVTNTPGPVVNNGVIVSLTGSTWTVTGTSYLTSLTISEDSTITAPEGYKMFITVDGADKAIKAGVYKGNIVIAVTKS